MTGAKLNPIGIDPASGKESCIWYNDQCEIVKPGEMRDKIEELCKSGPCFIAWDAPLSYSSLSFTDRVIDKATRNWVKELVEAGKFEEKAINAMPFSGLSHWVISREVLGLPNRAGSGSFPLYPHIEYSTEMEESMAGEVHPAVAMGCMWLNAPEASGPFPRYKGVKKTAGEAARKRIVKALGFPPVCEESDDILDAYVAWRMARDFLDRQARFLNAPLEGSYILPCKGLDSLLEEVSKVEKGFGK